jgi:tetratricopeptide (TPR) repeat protein
LSEPPALGRGGRLRKDGLFIAAVLLALGLLAAAYSNHFENGFHFDDSHVIVDNVAIRSLHDVGRFFTDATSYTARPQNASYRPLLTLSFALDYWAGGGLEPLVFHRTQFCLLLLVGTLLVPFYKRLADLGEPARGNRYLALFAATWFCVHTANTETVNYISSRSSLIATLGVVASFLIYMAWPGGRKTLVYLLPMLICGLAKPLTVILAPLLVAYDYLFEQRCSMLDLFRPSKLRSAGRSMLRGAPALGLGAGLFVFLRSMEPETLLYATVGRVEYLITQPFVWLHYVRLFFWPRGLTADTDWRFVESWDDPRLIVGVVFVFAVLVLTAVLSISRRLRPASFGLVWFALALLPSSSVFPLSEVYNEHRIFFPYVGLTLCVVWLFRIAFRFLQPADARIAFSRVAVSVALAAAVLAAHAAGTYRRNEVWENDLSLWADVAKKSPANGRGLMNYGLALMTRGRSEEALELFERALVFTPNYPILEINLGIVTSSLGRKAEAERHFERALELDPQYGRGHYYYATWLLQQSRGRDAMEHLERAVALTPWSLDSRVYLLRLYAATGFQRRLDGLVTSTLKIAPTEPTAITLASGELPVAAGDGTLESSLADGRARMRQELWVDAALLNRRAIGLAPDSATAWNNLGWSLGNLGFRTEAIRAFRQAIALDPEMELARNNLAWAERLLVQSED